MQIDFTEFHPLYHPLRRCLGYPGGPRRHIDYWWQFKGRERVAVAWKHATRRHEWRAMAWRDRFTNEWTYDVRCLGCEAKPAQKTKDRLITKMKTRPLPGFEENT
jgi:hypothetical protein